MPLRWNADYPLVRPMSQTNVSIAPSFYPGNELAVGLDLEEAKEIKSVCAAHSTCSVADVRFLTGRVESGEEYYPETQPVIGSLD